MTNVSQSSLVNVDRSRLTVGGDTFPPQNLTLDLSALGSSAQGALSSVKWEWVLLAGFALVALLIWSRK